jgi:Pyruvate/2-oxoacid:ferredoxin oxidoreductase delta subunit
MLDALHGYIYGRWTNQYISVVIHWLMPQFSAQQREHWANAYHGKVLTPELAVELVKLDHDVNARNLEQIIPYPVARDVILKSPVAVTLYECACRHARLNGCKPTDVCMVIGGAGDFALDHNPQSARRITQAEALDILRAEHERGHLHSAWFKDVLGDRLYAICNCCKCCCGGIEAMTQYGIRTMASSGYVATIDEASCTACGLCVDRCPFDALALEGTLASVDFAKCMGCGVCESQCAFEAIALRRDETKPAPLDVRVLA